MTHSLHRMGTQENLRNDYVVFAIAAQGINSEGAAPKFERFFQIVSRYNPVSMGDMKTGNVFSVGKEAIEKGFKGNSIVHAVFTDEDTVIQVLRELRGAELGPSIVVSGLLHETDRCCREAGLQRHTVEYSLGIWGRTEKLPRREILEITTMCGHGMVAFSLVEKALEDLEAGRTTAARAARELAAQCHCGIFNPARAEALLNALAKK